ncbi:MAG: chorismate synthase [Bacteroidales bacterium]|nr:chorismate synthase [Bacteroidales bacterium]
MAGNSIGKNLVLTTFGESHGTAIGGVLDGFPSGIELDLDLIQSEINRRNPAKYPFATARKEDDKLEVLSGIYEGLSTGAPIAFIVYNHDHRPEDYDNLKDLYRPSHADFTYEARYGIRDPRGGGRASARTTLSVVAGGAFAKQLLALNKIIITGYVSQIGPHSLPTGFVLADRSLVKLSPLACPHEKTTQKILDYLHTLKEEGDTAGGVISCVIKGVPAGIGDPLFGKLQADLAKAMLSINSVKGFEYGLGFASARMKGSEYNDEFILEDNLIKTKTNHDGGIQGGISNGMDITFNVAFKPISTLSMEQQTINRDGDQIIYKAEGRHDVCVVPRAVPIVEAMAALVLADKLGQG